jgi:hypothetical protein
VNCGRRSGAALDLIEQIVNIRGSWLATMEIKMADKRDYHVVPNSDRGGWDVRREGTERSSGHFDRKSEAMDRGRELARDRRSELIEHGRDGRTQDSDSYGHDPHPPIDKKH